MCILIWIYIFSQILRTYTIHIEHLRNFISILCNGILELTWWLEGYFHLVYIDKIRCRSTKENHVVLCWFIHQYVGCEPIFYCSTVSYSWGEPILYKTGKCTTNAISVDVFIIYLLRTFFCWPIVTLDLVAVTLNVCIKLVKATTYGIDQPKTFPWLNLCQTSNYALQPSSPYTHRVIVGFDMIRSCNRAQSNTKI